MTFARHSIAIVGVGPRGVSVLERIAAYLKQRSKLSALTIHLIESVQIGAGSIWRTDQPRSLCMNTLAGRLTLFTEPGASVRAPVIEGPSLYDWICLVREEYGLPKPEILTIGATDSLSPESSEISTDAINLYRRNPAKFELLQDFLPEIAQTIPTSYPSRALYGIYLCWFAEVAQSLLPDWVKVSHHHARATAIHATEEHDEIILENGKKITADTMILALGWQKTSANAEEQAIEKAMLANPSLKWIRPGNPIEQPVHGIPANQKVLVRGLGMGFFDFMALTTINRGGVFKSDSSQRSGLHYYRSGQEPYFLLTSGRGYPYFPKSDYKELPPDAKIARLKKTIQHLSLSDRGPAGICFDSEVWPAIARDAYEAYYHTLWCTQPSAIKTSLQEIIQDIDRFDVHDLPKMLLQHAPDHVLDLAYWENPLAHIAEPIEQFTQSMGHSLEKQICEAVKGWDSPLKVALWSISFSRKPSSILAAQGSITLESRRNRYAAVMALGAMAGSGPPLFRIRELLALVDAGLVSFIGAKPKLTYGEYWELSSPNTMNIPYRASVLMDAWMHSPDVRRNADPLLNALIKAKRVTPFMHRTKQGRAEASASPQVDQTTRRLVHPNGYIDARLHFIGIPTYDQYPDTTISPIPKTDALMLQETDAAAVDALKSIGY